MVLRLVAAVVVVLWAQSFHATPTLAPSLMTPATVFKVPPAARPWKRQYLKVVHEVWGLNYPSWLAAQVGQESSWRDGLTSKAHARGLCQFIAPTAIGIERQHPGLVALGRYSPAWCFRAQAILMKDLYRTYKAVRDPCNTIKLAGSAYNGGPMMLNREIGLCHKDVKKGCHYEHWEHIAPKNARAEWAWKENRDYVFRITQRSKAYADDGWGADYCAPAPPIQPPPAEAPLPKTTPAP